jgi:hypothetical protein
LRAVLDTILLSLGYASNVKLNASIKYHVYRHKKLISDFDISDTYIEIAQCAECNSIPTPSKPHRGQKVIKFIYSEKATKFCKIFFPLLLTLCTVVKSKGKISQKFLVFSEYMNFKATLVEACPTPVPHAPF